MLACWLLIAALSISNAFLPTPTTVSAKDVWQKPGCHKVGKCFLLSIETFQVMIRAKDSKRNCLS